jgi:hypothetical protein
MRIFAPKGFLMNKSIRNLALSTVLLLSAAPMFANRMGTNPHPQAISASLSLRDYVSILVALTGL